MFLLVLTSDNGDVGIMGMLRCDDRSVHGFATKDHSMWTFGCNFCYGGEISLQEIGRASCRESVCT